jgi:UDP-GlcNAc:undecaprenyl-phosphate GlcNAc-1-phosphate transferase
MSSLLSIIIAFIITVTSIVLIKPLALRIGLVDTPGGRKRHQGNIPLVGGIAMSMGFISSLLVLPISLSDYRSFLAGFVLLMVIGVLDDFHELSTRSRFGAQLIASLLIVCWGKVQLQHLGNLLFLGNIVLSNWAIPITVIAVIGVINAVNMSDGVDGLAGGLVLIELSWLLWLSIHAGNSSATLVIIPLLSALLGFLCFNMRFPGRPHALVFMGDAGSMPLGLALVWFLISLTQSNPPAANPVTMLWIMWIPLFDMVGVFIRRLFQQRSPFSPDREHLHHLFIAMGLSPTQITLLLCGLAAVGGGIGIVSQNYGISEGIMFTAFLILFAGYVGCSFRFWKRGFTFYTKRAGSSS